MTHDRQILSSLRRLERQLSYLEEAISPITEDKKLATQQAFAEANPDHRELIKFIINQAELSKNSPYSWKFGVLSDEIKKYGAPTSIDMRHIRAMHEIYCHKIKNNIQNLI